jgi:uncharacterized membrane protein
MIVPDHVYFVLGLFFASAAILGAGDRSNPKRFGNAAFWGLLSISFLFGSRLPDGASGLLACALALLAGAGVLGRSAPATTSQAQRLASAIRRGDWLFVPALIIPGATLAGTLAFGKLKLGGVALVDPHQVTLVALGLGIIAALAIAMLWLRPPAAAPLQEGRRLLDAIGWAAVLPQMLAALGAIFAHAGVGRVVGELLTRFVPLDRPFEAVGVYCIGMAAFTVIMGNAFAAFPVMTAAIGLPLIVHRFGGDPAIMGSIGMLAGFCGTLATPMAANFNIVPAALLDLPDRYAVIRVQLPTAAVMLAANTVLMYALVFRF